jgi:hypothetical protein
MTDILDDTYESDLTDEEHERLVLMSEHAIAKPLSPAARAVQDAAMQYEINPECYSREIAAATLRAAAEQIEDLYCADLVIDDSDGAVFVLRQLMLIADELDAQ